MVQSPTLPHFKALIIDIKILKGQVVVKSGVATPSSSKKYTNSQKVGLTGQ